MGATPQICRWQIVWMAIDGEGGGFYGMMKRTQNLRCETIIFAIEIDK